MKNLNKGEVEVSFNYHGDLTDNIKMYNEDKDKDLIFVKVLNKDLCISPYDNDTMSLTVEEAEKLILELQIIVSQLKGWIV
jgi:hypothetical protein